MPTENRSITPGNSTVSVGWVGSEDRCRCERADVIPVKAQEPILSRVAISHWRRRATTKDTKRGSVCGEYVQKVNTSRAREWSGYRRPGCTSRRALVTQVAKA